MGGKRRRFTDEFKCEALRFHREGGLSYSQAAQEYEIPESSLYRWHKQEQVDGGKGDGLTTEERESFRRDHLFPWTVWTRDERSEIVVGEVLCGAGGR